MEGVGLLAGDMVVPHILVHDAQEGALVRHDNHDAVTHDDEREPLPRANVRDGANGPTRSGGEEAPVARAQPAELLAAERQLSREWRRFFPHAR